VIIVVNLECDWPNFTPLKSTKASMDFVVNLKKLILTGVVAWRESERWVIFDPNRQIYSWDEGFETFTSKPSILPQYKNAKKQG